MSPHPLRTGSAFALTVAVGYTACTLLFWAFPASATNFMNSLFHGLDFSRLQSEPPGFGFGGFAGALAVITIWAFFLGAIFSFIHEKLGKR